MELQSGRNNSGQSEALEPIELPVFEKSRQSVYPYFAEQESPLLHYWRILKKRRWTLAATLGIIFALSVITALNTTRLYQATSKVAIFPETPNVLVFKDQEYKSHDNHYALSSETQAAILHI